MGKDHQWLLFKRSYYFIEWCEQGGYWSRVAIKEWCLWYV